MFDHASVDDEVAAARKLERIYHKGQDKAWNGKRVLAELVERHGSIQLAPEKMAPLRRLFAVIFWGELAAWKVASELALHLEPLEAKMAATSQAHDEARHFYVMRDYLALLDYTPSELPAPAARILENILNADSLIKKLVGMQLMVEPIALTLFQMVRENELEPVLCDLLQYFERDEARHIGLGINYLPQMFRALTPLQTLDLWQWELRMIEYEIRGMALLEEDFRALGFTPRDVLRLGMAKQIRAAELMMAELGEDLPSLEVFNRIAEARFELSFPEEGQPSGRRARMHRAARVILRGPATERVSVPLTTVEP